MPWRRVVVFDWNVANPCRSEPARDKRESTAGCQTGRVIVDVFREQARSYSGVLFLSGIQPLQFLLHKIGKQLDPDRRQRAEGVQRMNRPGVQSILPVLRDAGSIILTSSLAATRVFDGHAVYAGSKSAIGAFARNWALELRARRIRVNVLSPGPVDTAIIAKLGVTEEQRPDFMQMMADMIPAGRLGEADELARAALYLASSDSSFVNGIELHVDGGMSLV